MRRLLRLMLTCKRKLLAWDTAGNPTSPPPAPRNLRVERRNYPVDRDYRDYLDRSRVALLGGVATAAATTDACAVVVCSQASPPVTTFGDFVSDSLYFCLHRCDETSCDMMGNVCWLFCNTMIKVVRKIGFDFNASMSVFASEHRYFPCYYRRDFVITFSCGKLVIDWAGSILYFVFSCPLLWFLSRFLNNVLLPLFSISISSLFVFFKLGLKSWMKNTSRKQSHVCQSPNVNCWNILYKSGFYLYFFLLVLRDKFALKNKKGMKIDCWYFSSKALYLTNNEADILATCDDEILCNNKPCDNKHSPWQAPT